MKTLALRATALVAVFLPAVFAASLVDARQPNALSSAGAPDTIRFEGLPHVARGDATIDLVEGRLVVGNIGSTGADGVGVLGFKMAQFAAELGEIGTAAAATEGIPIEGAHLEMAAFGMLDGMPGSFLGSSRITQASAAGVAEYQISADFSPMGATKFVCEVFDGENRVIRVGGLDNAVAIIGSWPSKAGYAFVKDYYPLPEGGGPPGAGGLLAAEWNTITTGAVLIVENRFDASRDTTVMGDRVRILAEDPDLSGTFLSAYDLLAKDIPMVSIVAETSDTWNVRAIHEGSGDTGGGDGLSIFPNPAPIGGAFVSFRVALPHSSVDLSVFDASGRRVRTLASGALPRGPRSLAWDGRDDGGRSVGAGIYFLRLSVGEQLETQRVTLVR